MCFSFKIKINSDPLGILREKSVWSHSKACTFSAERNSPILPSGVANHSVGIDHESSCPFTEPVRHIIIHRRYPCPSTNKTNPSPWTNHKILLKKLVNGSVKQKIVFVYDPFKCNWNTSALTLKIWKVSLKTSSLTSYALRCNTYLRIVPNLQQQKQEVSNESHQSMRKDIVNMNWIPYSYPRAMDSNPFEVKIGFILQTWAKELGKSFGLYQCCQARRWSCPYLLLPLTVWDTGKLSGNADFRILWHQAEDLGHLDL